MKRYDNLKCLETINNVFDQPLFIKDQIYTVLYIDGDNITLNHILYANEYREFPLKFINENFEIYEEDKNTRSIR